MPRMNIIQPWMYRRPLTTLLLVAFLCALLTESVDLLLGASFAHVPQLPQVLYKLSQVLSGLVGVVLFVWAETETKLSVRRGVIFFLILLIPPLISGTIVFLFDFNLDSHWMGPGWGDRAWVRIVDPAPRIFSGIFLASLFFRLFFSDCAMRAAEECKKHATEETP